MVKRKSSGGGSTLYGVLAGLLIGLVAAVVVAFYVIKSPKLKLRKPLRCPQTLGRLGSWARRLRLVRGPLA